MKAVLRWRRALADRALRRKPHGVTLVAIAQDEGPHLLEWLAHHLAVGFDRIVVYDNESRDDTRALFKAAASADLRLRRIPWPTPLDVSAKVLGYHHVLSDLVTPWVMYLDLDEFLVPFGYPDITGLIESLPDSVASLHVNRRDFDSPDPEHGLVTRAVTRCAPYGARSHYRFKTLARADRILAVEAHDVRSSHGRRILSDGLIFADTADHAADRVVFDGVQINRYRRGSRSGLQMRMESGAPPDSVEERDCPAMENHAILAFDARFESEYQRLRGRSPPRPALSG